MSQLSCQSLTVDVNGGVYAAAGHELFASADDGDNNAEFDRQIESDVVEFFQLCNPSLDPATAALIAKIGSEVIRTLQTSALLTDDQTLQMQLLVEAKQLLFCYLQPYLKP